MKPAALTIQVEQDNLLYTLIGLRTAVETTKSKQNEKRYRKAYVEIHEQVPAKLAVEWFEKYDLCREIG